MITVSPSLLHGADMNKNNDGTVLDDPNMQVRVHYSTDIFVTVTNFGLIGSQGGDWIDPETGQPAPGAELPGSSGFDYLFQGALWIGAEVDTVDQYGNPALDTLVSVGNDGWWSSIYELLPPPEGEESLWEQQVIGDEEYFAVYYDTLTDPSYVNPDPNDQRVHLPLGLKITQNSAGWSTDGYNEFIIINYILENIGGRYLHNTWIGIYYDGDVMHESENPYGQEQGAQDDLCGYIQHGDYGIAWIADNDGQVENGNFTYHSPRGLTGLVSLGMSDFEYQTNFNWWISNSTSAYDWGPQWQSNFDRWGYFPGGGMGTPGGDKAKYQVMSNSEHDYGQIWSNLDHTDEGWIPPSPQAPDLANGYDTRFLISYGPFDILPDAVETLTVALIGGNNLHIDPSNYIQNLRNNTHDSLSVAQYYDNLDFSDLLIKADSAISFYEHDYANVPPGPPTALNFTDWSENHVTLEWQPVFPPSLVEYRIYRGTEPGVYDPEKITPDGFIDSAFVDTDVENNTTYYYVIASVNTLGMEGDYSNEAIINTGQPQTPTGLTATPGNTEVQLSWEANPDSDLVGYAVYRSFPDEDFVVLDTVETTAYFDEGLINGLEYSYTITAIDIFGYSSFFSDTVAAIPMGLDSGILLYYGNRRILNPDFDSMTVFYHNILQGFQHTITDELPRSLQDIAPYSTIIFCKERLLGFPLLNYYYDYDFFSTYLELGGNIILAGTRLLAPVTNYDGTVYFPEDRITNRCFNLEGAIFPSIINCELAGGDAVSSLFSDFSIDTVRANRNGFPPNQDNYSHPFGVGTLIPIDSNEVIYIFEAVNPDSSDFHGLPVGIIHQTDTYNTAVLEFPLYYVEESISFEILHTILDEFGEVQTDLLENDGLLPTSTALLQNYPNPFNGRTVVEYQLAAPGYVEISIYNILGQKIAILADEKQEAGRHSITWDAADFPSGVYFARLETGERTENIKMVLLK